uniref:Cytochrome n=1 Tax=Lutzomyia longipalpis TaxID=7200 RepID=A0A1B0CSW3_LUTLO
MFVLEVILGLILCIGALLWWWQRSARLYWEKNGVSYIDGPPFIGALKDSMMFKKSFGELFLDIYNHEKFKDDPVTGVYFFHKPSLVIRHPELIKNILVKDFPNFIDRGVNSDPHDDGIGRDNLFSVKGQRWKTIRTKLSPVFTTGKLKNLFLLMMDVSKTLERKLQTEIGDIPKEYEMKEFVFIFSTDTNIKFVPLAFKLISLLNPNAEFHKNAKIAFDFKLKRAFQFCTCFFFPELAMFLRFAFFSRETNEFLRSSINYVMDERVKKTLRLYPSLPFLDRICAPADGSDSYSLEPYHSFSIPRGMPVYIPHVSIQRDPKFYPNPLEFIPERFSSENRDSINQYAFLSFGIGPRNCIGSRFGYLQVKLALITILRYYRVEATERTPKSIEFAKKSLFMAVLEVISGLILCISALIWWWQRSARLYWEKNGVSYIEGPPFIGALKDSMTFRKSFGELFLEIYNHEKFKDDPVTGVYFFHKPSLVIRHPELIKNILVKDFSNFVDRPVNSDPYDDGIGRDNLFSVKGLRWKTIRAKVSPVFTTGKLKNLFLLLVDVTKILEQKLQTEIGDEPKEYEMKEFASFFTTDTIALCAFGVQANSLLNPKSDFHINVKRTFDFNWKRGFQFASCFFLPELATLFRFAFFSKETNEFIRSSINYVMEERIKKTLRLYPSLPFLDRVCSPPDNEENYSLEPYHTFAIPKGMPVYIPLIAIQRDEKYFPNPEEFIPERFSPENRDSINQYSYLSFGIGPRNCIGSRFGYLQVKLALITILNNYRVEATERTPKTIEFDKKALVVHSQEPLYMNLTRSKLCHIYAHKLPNLRSSLVKYSFFKIILLRDKMFTLQVILGLILCFGALIWWWQRSAKLYWEKNGVSYIPGPPFIGALKDCLTFRKSFGELLMDIYNHEKFKDDPVIGVYFFHKPCLVIRHPELIKNILVKDFANFVDRTMSSDPLVDRIGTDNLFAVKGLRWKIIRNKISPIFTTGNLKNLFLLMVDVTKILEQKLQTEIGDESKEYEMKEFASFFTTDTIALCAFGVQANSLLNPKADFHKNVKNAFDFALKRVFQFTSCFFLQEIAKFFRFQFLSKETNEFLRSSINYVMDERMKSGKKQILRLYPPLPFLDRVCSPPDGNENYSLEPYHSFAIPKGMPVYIPSVAIQRDEKYFPNPEEFIPERFSPENRDSTDQYTFLAFGLGPRNCLGLRFGYFTVKLALITILRNYRIEVTDRTPKIIKFQKKALALISEDPLYMNLTKLSCTYLAVEYHSFPR